MKNKHQVEILKYKNDNKHHQTTIQLLNKDMNMMQKEIDHIYLTNKMMEEEREANQFKVQDRLDLQQQIRDLVAAANML
ncbi:MAG: hypothetical protein ACKO96_33955 [Flammeovirgaceae bacterium]